MKRTFAPHYLATHAPSFLTKIERWLQLGTKEGPSGKQSRTTASLQTFLMQHGFEPDSFYIGKDDFGNITIEQPVSADHARRALKSDGRVISPV